MTMGCIPIFFQKCFIIFVQFNTRHVKLLQQMEYTS